jgi:KaiC/GvpD/RAD55 family RecA-like ATPase
MINALKREGLTPLLLRELVEGEVLGTVSEEYTADAVLHLTMERVNGQRMRFMEVIKSRGSEHTPAKSLFHITDGGLDIVPPFHEPFFRYQDAVSVGVPDLDALLGGGIPHGAFYLMEVTPDLHQEILELNYMLEAARAHDVFLELATASTRTERLGQLAQSYGMRYEFDEALAAGNLRIINAFTGRTLGADEGDELAESDQQTSSLSSAVDALEEAFEGTTAASRGRLYLDLTRLLTNVPDEAFFGALIRMLDLVQRHEGVLLGFINPDAIPASVRQKLLTEADGIVRMWKDGNYKFVQVTKTVNSVQSPVFTIRETNNPPFLRIQ